MPAALRERLASMLGYVEQDPSNLRLLADTANAAFDVGELVTALDLLQRHQSHETLPLPLVNLVGLIALRQGDVADAARAFDTLLSSGVTEPSVKFNRAWVHALANEHEAVLALLDEDTVAVTPRASALRVQTLHHLDRIEEALVEGAAMAERFPGNDDLLGALSVAAMDVDDFALARDYANKAQGGTDALTTRGLVALNDDDPAGALALFDQALATQPDAARAWLGKGLGLLASGDVSGGSKALIRGAEIFGDHLGSWIAVGWTQFIARDLAAARQTFEHALLLDENFAESHGGLAVLDISEGKLDSGKRRAEIALRLDRECFGGMLARMLLQEAAGNEAGAQRIWDKAMSMPAGVDGKTLAQAMLGLGLDLGRSKGRPS